LTLSFEAQKQETNTIWHEYKYVYHDNLTIKL